MNIIKTAAWATGIASIIAFYGSSVNGSSVKVDCPADIPRLEERCKPVFSITKDEVFVQELRDDGCYTYVEYPGKAEFFVFHPDNSLNTTKGKLVIVDYNVFLGIASVSREEVCDSRKGFAPKGTDYEHVYYEQIRELPILDNEAEQYLNRIKEFLQKIKREEANLNIKNAN